MRATRARCTLRGRLRLQPTLLGSLVEATRGAVVQEVMEVQRVEVTLVQAVEEVRVVGQQEEEVVVEAYKVNYKPWPPWVEEVEDLVEDRGQDVELWLVEALEDMEEVVEVMEEVAVVEDTT